MTRPQLHAVYFGAGQYPRLAQVLEMTANRHCPGWDVTVRQMEPAPFRADSGRAADADNHWKLCEWRRLVVDAPDGARVLLVDADTFVTGPLDELWDIPFDLAFTARDACRYPMNGGVIAARVSPATRAFMNAWVAQDAAHLQDKSAMYPWRRQFGGMNQASFGAVRATGVDASLGMVVAELPCRIWNCEDTTWAQFSPATRIVHVKSALRMAVFDMVAATPETRHLAKLWRSLDAEASAAATHAAVA